MKKLIFIVLFVCMIFVLVACQNKNIEPEIVGKWQSENFSNSTYIFRSNGTFERTTAENDYYEGTYTALNGVLTLDYGEKYVPEEYTYKFNHDKSSVDYGDLKIRYEYFERVD